MQGTVAVEVLVVAKEVGQEGEAEERSQGVVQDDISVDDTLHTGAAFLVLGWCCNCCCSTREKD